MVRGGVDVFLVGLECTSDMMDAMHTEASVTMPRATMKSCKLRTVHSTALGPDVVCAGQPGRLVAAVSGKTPSDKTMQAN